MGTVFQPSLNFWAGSGIGISLQGHSLPSSALNHSSLLLYVHGYNNDEAEASVSYNEFQTLQNRLGGLSANIVGILWPGASWSGELFYMKAISQAEKVGAKLAKQLHTQAKSSGYLKLDIVAHSLGNRLMLETIKALINLLKTDPAPIFFGQMALMAAAVPVRYLEANKQLNAAINAFSSSLNLYSNSDNVLHFAFPAGQSAAGQGFFPVALGRKQWLGAQFSVPSMRQVENVGYGHGDYWGGRSDEVDINKHAAKKVRDFMPHIGKLPQRVIDAPVSLSRNPISRSQTKARIISSRSIPTRI